MNAPNEAATRATGLLSLVADRIRALGHVSRAVLYVHLRAHVSLEEFDAILATLRRHLLVSETCDRLCWIRDDYDSGVMPVGRKLGDPQA